MSPRRISSNMFWEKNPDLRFKSSVITINKIYVRKPANSMIIVRRPSRSSDQPIKTRHLPSWNVVLWQTIIDSVTTTPVKELIRRIILTQREYLPYQTSSKPALIKPILIDLPRAWAFKKCTSTTRNMKINSTGQLNLSWTTFKFQRAPIIAPNRGEELHNSHTKTQNHCWCWHNAGRILRLVYLFYR